MTDIIGEGGFGCIFYPGFNCKNKTNSTTNVVSKLQLNHFNAQNEIYIGNIIKSIPNYSLYFLPVISSCSISLGSLSKEAIDKCDIINTSTDKYIILQIPHLKNISFLDLFGDTKRSTRHLFLTFIETYNYIAISISLLLDKNIVHFDIKEDNILYST